MLAYVMILSKLTRDVLYTRTTTTTTVLSKYLKIWFASTGANFSKRPPSDNQPEPGMPSSHAMDLIYLAYFYGNHLKLSPRLYFLVLSVAFGLSIMRVTGGHHTLAQVLVGALLGFLFSGAWDAFIKKIDAARLIDQQILSYLEIQPRRVVFVFLSIILIYLFNMANNRWKRSFKVNHSSIHNKKK